LQPNLQETLQAEDFSQASTQCCHMYLCTAPLFQAQQLSSKENLRPNWSWKISVDLISFFDLVAQNSQIQFTPYL